MRRLSLVLAAAAALLTVGGALAAAPAGKAVGVDPSASNQAGGTTRTLVVGADVGIGDKIVTGASGQVQLVFSDDTHLVVGPSSSLVIQSYLLRGGQTASKFAVNALSGSFRFITGKSDHAAYTISSPTGTIGVRGTAFDFNVDKLGTTVALFRGAVILCTLDNKCEVLDHKCEAGLIDPIKTSIFGHFQAIDDNLRSRFHYILSQKPLLTDFHVDESRLCFLDNNPAPGGLAPTTSGGVFIQPPPR